ncbi:MAG: DNA-binding protein WhiA, partial [Lachnospiraceae bacterium]|nr:DNA-binding protein WhiA [Lachnospiraceae bacterium]
MSFSGLVKEELAAHVDLARHCQLAELAALLHFCGSICEEEGKSHLSLETENEAVIRKCFTLLEKTFKINKVTVQRKGRLLFDDSTEDKVIRALHFGREENGTVMLHAPVSSLLIKNSCCARAFLRGVFLCVGSMSDPEKSYHLEFVCSRKDQAKQLKDIIQEFGIEAR